MTNVELIDADELRRLKAREEQLRELWDGAPLKAVGETWNVEQAAKFLHVHRDTLYTLASRGEVPATKIGRRWVFSSRRLAEYFTAKTDAARGRQKAGGLVQILAEHRKARGRLPRGGA
jgi:excisionase family DNA binding protein